MKTCTAGFLVIFACVIVTTGCDALSDPATRLAFGIESDAKQLGSAEGSTYSIEGLSPVRSGECDAPYTVQLDKVGALIVWCKNANGQTTASGSTSYHSRFVITPKIYLLDKPAGSTLTVDIKRHNGRAVIVSVN